MYQGQFLSLPDSTDLTLWSPWMPKAADRAVLTYELIGVGGVAAFEIEVWTKSREDRSSQGTKIAEATDFVNVGGTQFYTATDIDDFDELFRVRIHFEGGEGGASVIYRFLTPTWYDLAGSQS